MKKIGIISRHASYNYGAILQSYALQKYIRDRFNFEVEHINWRPGKLSFQGISLKNKIKNKVRLIIYFLVTQKKESKKVKFNRFLNENIFVSKLYDSLDKIMSSPPKYDIYISGSDQVFNPYNIDYEVLYLKFAHKSAKKIAFSPSFGVNEIPQDKKEVISSLLRNFNFLSSRESSGVQIIKGLINKTCPVTLDPIFLLNKKDFCNLEKKMIVKYTKFILCYFLVDFSEKIELARKLQKRTSLPIIAIKSSVPSRIKGLDLILRDVGPREFLWLFNNASYIITDSFHGTAFSILFNKNFFSKIGVSKTSERILNILSLAGLSDRMILSSNDLEQIDLEINYISVNQKIDMYRNKTMDYLEEALNEQ